MTAAPYHEPPSAAPAHGCPLCKTELRRTWRRPVDRFASLFVPMHRYGCGTFSCQWEGNFRIHGASSKGQEATDRVRISAKPVSSRLPALIASGSALAAVLVVILIGSQWQNAASWANATKQRDDTVASTDAVPIVHGREIPIGPRRNPVAGQLKTKSPEAP